MRHMLFALIACLGLLTQPAAAEPTDNLTDNLTDKQLEAVGPMLYEARIDALRADRYRFWTPPTKRLAEHSPFSPLPGHPKHIQKMKEAFESKAKSVKLAGEDYDAALRVIASPGKAMTDEQKAHHRAAVADYLQRIGQDPRDAMLLRWAKLIQARQQKIENAEKLLASPASQVNPTRKREAQYRVFDEAYNAHRSLTKIEIPLELFPQSDVRDAVTKLAEALREKVSEIEPQWFAIQQQRADFQIEKTEKALKELEAEVKAALADSKLSEEKRKQKALSAVRAFVRSIPSSEELDPAAEYHPARVAALADRAKALRESISPSPTPEQLAEQKKQAEQSKKQYAAGDKTGRPSRVVEAFFKALRNEDFQRAYKMTVGSKKRDLDYFIGRCKLVRDESSYVKTAQQFSAATSEYVHNDSAVVAFKLEGSDQERERKIYLLKTDGFWRVSHELYSYRQFKATDDQKRDFITLTKAAREGGDDIAARYEPDLSTAPEGEIPAGLKQADKDAPDTDPDAEPESKPDAKPESKPQPKPASYEDRVKAVMGPIADKLRAQVQAELDASKPVYEERKKKLDETQLKIVHLTHGLVKRNMTYSSFYKPRRVWLATVDYFDSAVRGDPKLSSDDPIEKLQAQKDLAAFEKRIMKNDGQLVSAKLLAKADLSDAISEPRARFFAMQKTLKLVSSSRLERDQLATLCEKVGDDLYAYLQKAKRGQVSMFSIDKLITDAIIKHRKALRK